MCVFTFQNFLDVIKLYDGPTQHDRMLSTWLLQESFNTICAATIVVVDVCVESLSQSLHEKKIAMKSIVDLLFQILIMPQSPVTHLRAVGAALLVLEGDIKLFVDVVDTSLEHWVRIMLSLMNCHSLSVRSIAVDFVVSLFSGIYSIHGNVETITMIFVSILPEIIAREIALYTIGGHITTMDDASKSVWPIRRAIADIGDTNPLDDDRIDQVLGATLSTFSRACQAAIDGILIELRLEEDKICIVGVNVPVDPATKTAFDADEESLFEVASFFTSEIAPLQRIRWLLTLNKLHAKRSHWVEAAECLFLCATTICDALPFLKNMWRPSKLEQWSDKKQSPWLDIIGEDIGHPSCENAEVMTFAETYLDPYKLFGERNNTSNSGKSNQLTIKGTCELLTRVTKDAINYCRIENGFEAFYYNWLSTLLESLSVVVDVLDNQLLSPKVAARMKQAEDGDAIHNVSTFIRKEMNALSGFRSLQGKIRSHPSYVMIRVYGKKPSRFEESTTIPTFLEWDKWCICRLPNQIFRKDADTNNTSNGDSNMDITLFAKPYVEALSENDTNVILRTNIVNDKEPNGIVTTDVTATYIDVIPIERNNLQTSSESSSTYNSKYFYYYHQNDDTMKTIIEIAVATEFPCALSRQSIVEYNTNNNNNNTSNNM
jgi:hypothetical protein